MNQQVFHLERFVSDCVHVWLVMLVIRFGREQILKWTIDEHLLLILERVLRHNESNQRSTCRIASDSADFFRSYSRGNDWHEIGVINQ